MPHNFQPGDRVVVNGKGGNAAYFGQEGVVASNNGQTARVEFDNHGQRVGDDRITNCPWNLDYLDLVEAKPVETAPTTETVDGIVFTSDEAREVAQLNRSFRMLSQDSKATLNALSAGEPVTLDAARNAAFSAMKCATTANGQSMGRRADAAQVERLWDAISAATPTTLDVSTTSADLEAARHSLDDYAAQVAKLRREVGEQVRLADAAQQAAGTFQHELARANERVEEFRQRATDAETDKIEAEKAWKRGWAISDFARSLLDNVDKAKVEGFIEGFDFHRDCD